MGGSCFQIQPSRDSIGYLSRPAASREARFRWSYISQFLNVNSLKTKRRDFPGSLAVKNLPCHAGDAVLIPSWGTKIPHAVKQLSLRAATREPAWSGAHVLQPESPRTTTKDPV